MTQTNQTKQVKPTLVDVPETMLWTLHNRASEAKRRDGFLQDERAIEIYDNIAYDYERSFGKPDSSHAARSIAFDKVLTQWMKQYPKGAIVNLGEGLETQVSRIDNGTAHWYSIDVPDAIAIRERFFNTSERHHHIAKSALDLSWMEHIQQKDVFVTAQGLLMYFPPQEVQRLLSTIATRFPHVQIMFDVIPRWFSQKTLQGLKKTKYYETPPMPWGINQNEIEPTLHAWLTNAAKVSLIPYAHMRGVWGLLMRLSMQLPYLNQRIPTNVHIEMIRSS